MDLKEANQIIKTILDIGEEFIRSGAENRRSEDSLYRLCHAYGFKKVNIWLITTNIQATVETEDGDIITQTRYVPSGDYNFDRLDYLNDLSRKACHSTPDSIELRRMLDEVLNRPQQPKWMRYFAGLVSAVGFGIFFGCDAMDSCVLAIIVAVMMTIGDKLATVESNPLIYNAIYAFIAELMIITSVRFGFGHHANYITIGVVMLLIGCLGFTNGLRDLLNRDIIAGGINIVSSILGATGIAVGISIAILLLGGVSSISTRSPSEYVQIVSCVVGCIGFAVLFKIRGKQVFYSGIGALITWLTYLLVYGETSSPFIATMSGAMFVAAYANIMARVNKAPTTIFLVASVLPLIPGSHMYYMMYELVAGTARMSAVEARLMLIPCVAIAVGFIVVEIVNKYVLIGVHTLGDLRNRR